MDGVENGRYGYGVGGNMGGLGVWIESGGCGRKSGYGWEWGKWIWTIMGNMAYLFGMGGGGGGGVGVGFGGTMPTIYSTNTLDECVVLEMISVISAA